MRAHAINVLSIVPSHIDARDKVALADEIERLRSALAAIADGEGDAQEIARQTLSEGAGR